MSGEVAGADPWIPSTITLKVLTWTMRTQAPPLLGSGYFCTVRPPTVVVVCAPYDDFSVAGSSMATYTVATCVLPRLRSN